MRVVMGFEIIKMWQSLGRLYGWFFSYLFSLVECVHGHVGGVNKEMAVMLEELNILLGIELCFYANSSFSLCKYGYWSHERTLCLLPFVFTVVFF